MQWNIEVPVSLSLLSSLRPNIWLTPALTVTPKTVRTLLEKGFVVNVERSPVRIFEDKEFEDVGANMVPTGSWPDAPQDHIIIGLKELPEEECTFSRSCSCDPWTNVTWGQSP